MESVDGYPAKRARTRAALVRAAIEQLGEVGPAGLTVSGVAAAAGVSHGTFYNHLEGAGTLLQVVGEELASVFELGREHVRRLSGDPAARIALGLRQLLALPEVDPAFGRAFVALLGADPAFRTRIRTIVADEVRRGADRGVLTVTSVDASTDALLGAGLQSLRSALLGESPDTPEVVAATCLRVLGIEDPVATLDRSRTGA